MFRYILLCIAIFFLRPATAGAQEGFGDRAQKYVEQYASLAMYEQRKNGIPAAITLGQGILETEAGISELMTEANNHFGIKCKNGWQGETFTHTDDAPDECFKKYKCASDSYRDHSEHLKRNPRYAPLFRLKETDYKSWAVCLKRCGYATNPQYAQRLIKIIEDYDLQQYTYSAFDTNTTDKAPVTPVAAASIRIDTVKKTSVVKNTVAAPAAETAVVKQDVPQVPVTREKHIVKEGESLAMIARDEHVELRKLMSLNLLNINEEPLPGSTLELVTQAQQKPAVRVTAIVAHQGNAIVSGEDKPAGDYVAINKSPGRATDSFRTRTTPTPIAKPQTTVNTVPVANPGTPPTKPAPEIIIINESKRPVRPPDPKTEEELAEEKKDKELADLKAELDKIVYADDSKLIAQSPQSIVPEKKIAATPEKKPAPVARAEHKGSKTYTVKKGDTAFSIAKKNGITLEQLVQWNNLGTGGVKVGQTLQVKE